MAGRGARDGKGVGERTPPPEVQPVYFQASLSYHESPLPFCTAVILYYKLALFRDPSQRQHARKTQNHTHTLTHKDGTLFSPLPLSGVRPQRTQRCRGPRAWVEKHALSPCPWTASTVQIQHLKPTRTRAAPPRGWDTDTHPRAHGRARAGVGAPRRHASLCEGSCAFLSPCLFVQTIRRACVLTTKS